MIRRLLALLVLLLAVSSTLAVDAAVTPPGARTVTVHGGADGKVPGWSIVTVRPDGWTADCCKYARAIGVDQVIYHGDWTGEPVRVMVLNVWPTKLASLDGEWKADQKHYLQKDPAAKIATFPLHHPKLECRGFIYQGGDRIDDVVVFCDPRKHAVVRFSWSMAIAADDPTRVQVLTLFRQMVEASQYVKYVPPVSAASAAPHP